jgi:hypothetical protein
MRVIVLVKANKDSEAGKLPSPQLLTAMMKFNEELVKAGIMLAGEGLKDSSHGKRIRFSHRRPVHRDQGAGCRLLDLAGQVDGRSRGVAQAHAARRRR